MSKSTKLFIWAAFIMVYATTIDYVKFIFKIPEQSKEEIGAYLMANPNWAIILIGATIIIAFYPIMVLFEKENNKRSRS